MDTKIDKSQGYVIMWRSLMDTIIFKNEKLWQLYSWCLFRANHRIQEELPGLKRVHLEPGQFITSTRRAADALGFSVPTLYSYLNILEAEHQIERKVNNRYSVITILNWNELQNPERKTERQVDNKKNANLTQIIQGNTLNTQNTNKNNGNVPIEDNGDISSISSLNSEYVGEEELSTTEEPVRKEDNEIDKVYSLYKDLYLQRTGNLHPDISQAQWENVRDRLTEIQDEKSLELNDWRKKFFHWFNHCENLATDFNINHYISGLIDGYRDWEVLYSDNCPRCMDWEANENIPF